MINIPLIPTPWKIVAGIVAFSIYTGFVFYKGYGYADGQLAKKEREALVEEIKKANELSAKDLKSAIASMAKQEEIKKMFDNVKGDLERSIASKPVYANPDCTLDAHDLDLWNGVKK